MEDGRVWFDASAYMLFEATGDSEAQCFGASFDLESDSPPSEDDAQSCSYGFRSHSARLHEVVDAAGDDFRGSDFDDCSGDDEEEDEGGGSDEEDGVVDQCRRRKQAAAEKPAKSKVCEDSNLKIPNEREGDRQFWEACLAS